MKKIIKRCCVMLTLIVAFGFLFAGCGVKYTQVWKVQSGVMDGQEIDLKEIGWDDMTIKLSDTSECEFTADGDSMTGIYAIDDKVLTLTLEPDRSEKRDYSMYSAFEKGEDEYVYKDGDIEITATTKGDDYKAEVVAEIVDDNTLKIEELFGEEIELTLKKQAQ